MTVGGTRPIPAQRREALLRLLRADHVLSVRQLTQALGVSHMTVRRDIDTLEREGRVHSVPGGVRLASHITREPAFAIKSASETPEKQAIAHAASADINDGMVIYLDAGTTTGALIPALAQHHDLTVISNDFTIIDRLIDVPDAQLIHIGGRVDANTRSTVGRLAAGMIRRLNVDVSFISTSSWDLGRGVTTPSESKVGVKQAAIDASVSAVLVATSSKFGTFGLYDVAPLTRFDKIITDSHLPAPARKGIEDRGVTLQLAADDAGTEQGRVPHDSPE